MSLCWVAAQQVVYELHEKKQLVNHLANMQVDVYENAGDAFFASSNSIQLGDGRQLNGQKIIRPLLPSLV